LTNGPPVSTIIFFLDDIVSSSIKSDRCDVCRGAAAAASHMIVADILHPKNANQPSQNVLTQKIRHGRARCSRAAAALASMGCGDGATGQG
jgi:hypothetical protein